MPLIEMVASVGPEPVLQQPNLNYQQKLELLDLFLPAINVIKERHLRSSTQEVTPDKVYRDELILTGDVQKAQRLKAWQTLGQTRK